MLKSIIDSVIGRLDESGVENVYSAFDAYSVEKKGSIFTVVGVGAFESFTPVYSFSFIYLPYRVEIDINIIAAKSMSDTELYDYYTNEIEPVLMGMTDLNCTLRKIALKFDSNIQRLTLSAKMSVVGMTKIERGSL